MPRSPEPAHPGDAATAAAPMRRCAAFFHGFWDSTARVVALAPASSPADAAEQPAQRAVLQARTLHLPAAPPAEPVAAATDRAAAAAAHAAAHGRFGGPQMPRAGLKPVQQALLGVLEDARVEWLALQELPGLRALWLPFHEGPDAPRGLHFEALLARLARSLLDPAHQDVHPWVLRVRNLFFAGDANGRTLALVTQADVRQVASRLGHEIGQMRLPFQPRTYTVHAAYRDDNHHLWLPDPELPPSPVPLADGASGGASPPRPADAPPAPARPSVETDAPQADALVAADAGDPVASYAEWDYRIRRYRPAWCHVYESTAPALAMALLEDDQGWMPDAPSRPLAQALRGLRSGTVRPLGRAAWGDDFHPAGLVDARMQQRLRQPPEDAVYRRLARPPAPLAVLVLLDTSASTAEVAVGGAPLLDRLRDAGLATVAALEAAGHRAALTAFASQGRQRIEMQRIKDWHDAARAPEVMARLQGLRSAGSTRLGAVLRHAAWSAASAAVAPGTRRVVLLLTDGEAHDIDVHDPAYLAADMRRALTEADRDGVTMCCLLAGAAPGALPPMARHYPPGACAPLRRTEDLPRILPGLLAVVA